MARSTAAIKSDISSAEKASTVTVACKVPNGILLRVFREEKSQEPVLGGGWREVKRSVPVGDPIHISGPAVPYGEAPKTKIEHGFALTFGVPADVWKVWLEQNADSDMVRNGLIFAQAKDDGAVAKSKEMSGEKSGLEPLNPAMTTKNGQTVPVDPRYPKRANGNVSAIHTADV